MSDFYSFMEGEKAESTKGYTGEQQEALFNQGEGSKYPALFYSLGDPNARGLAAFGEWVLEDKPHWELDRDVLTSLGWEYIDDYVFGTGDDRREGAAYVTKRLRVKAVLEERLFNQHDDNGEVVIYDAKWSYDNRSRITQRGQFKRGRAQAIIYLEGVGVTFLGFGMSYAKNASWRGSKQSNARAGLPVGARHVLQNKVREIEAGIGLEPTGNFFHVYSFDLIPAFDKKGKPIFVTVGTGRNSKDINPFVVDTRVADDHDVYPARRWLTSEERETMRSIAEEEDLASWAAEYRNRNEAELREAAAGAGIRVNGAVAKPESVPAQIEEEDDIPF